MTVSMPGSAPWRNANASQLDALYTRVLQQTGEKGLAQDAARAAEAALRDIYNQAMVSSGGNRQAALRATEAHTSTVFQLAGLVPTISGDDPQAASAALREAQGVLRQAGYTDPQFMYPWLRANVSNDQVLRGAGLDPQRVRHVDSPWAHADLEGLMGIARQMLDNYRDRDGQALSADQVSDYMDQAYAYARQHGVGAQYVRPERDAAAPTEGADETFTIQDLDIPRRV